RVEHGFQNAAPSAIAHARSRGPPGVAQLPEDDACGGRVHQIEGARPYRVGLEAVLPDCAPEGGERQGHGRTLTAGARSKIELAAEQAVADRVDRPVIAVPFEKIPIGLPARPAGVSALVAVTRARQARVREGLRPED